MIDLHKLEDNKYREQLKNKLGDKEYRRVVVEQLLDEYQNRIYSFCVSWLDRSYGEEIAQEVFISAFKNLPNYHGDSSISTWLVGIAKNACRKCWRDQRRHQQIMIRSSTVIQANVHGVNPISPEDKQVNDEEQAEEQEKNVTLTGCIKKLPNEEGHLIKWRYLKNKSIAEISDLLDEKPDTLYKRCKRALKKLKKCIQDES